MQSQSTNIKKEGKELLDTLNDLSKPSRPETDNHETGFWKGLSIGLGVALLVTIIKNKN